MIQTHYYHPARRQTQANVNFGRSQQKPHRLKGIIAPIGFILMELGILVTGGASAVQAVTSPGTPQNAAQMVLYKQAMASAYALADSDPSNTPALMNQLSAPTLQYLIQYAQTIGKYDPKAFSPQEVNQIVNYLKSLKVSDPATQAMLKKVVQQISYLQSQASVQDESFIVSAPFDAWMQVQGNKVLTAQEMNDFSQAETDFENQATSLPAEKIRDAAIFFLALAAAFLVLKGAQALDSDP